MEFDPISLERAIDRVKGFAPVPDLTNLELIGLRQILQQCLKEAEVNYNTGSRFDPYNEAAARFLVEYYDFDIGRRDEYYEMIDPEDTKDKEYIDRKLALVLKKRQEERHKL